MTAAPGTLFGGFVLSLANGEIDFDSATLVATLHTSSYTPAEADRYFDDTTNELPTADGYTAGGVTLTGVMVTLDTATNTITVDCDPFGWDPSTITARWVVISIDTGSPATSPLVGYLNPGGDVATVGGGNFEVTPHADGLLTGTY